jgi:hypothetical protein
MYECEECGYTGVLVIELDEDLDTKTEGKKKMEEADPSIDSTD